MSNQTPPAWALNAAREIIRVNEWFVIPNADTLAYVIAARAAEAASYCAAHNTYPEDNEPCWQCVNKHAPDAEALAVALEDGLQLFDGPRESTHDWYTGRIEIRKRMVEALAPYRAAHPKVSA